MLLELLGAVRIRSDVERKRLHAYSQRERDHAGIDRGRYTPDATDARYRRLCALTASVVGAGHIAIVDATFLKRWQRELLRELSFELQVPFVIDAECTLECARAPESWLPVLERIGAAPRAIADRQGACRN